MQNKFTQKAQNTLNRAEAEAGALGHTYIGSEHILLGLAAEADSIASRILSARGLSACVIRRSITDIAGEGEKCRTGAHDMTAHAREIIESSGNVAKKKGCTYIGTEHLLSALLDENGSTGVKIIEASGIPVSVLKSDLSAHQGAIGLTVRETVQDTQDAPYSKKRFQTGALALYSRDLTELARIGKTDVTVGREAETARIIHILARRQKNNPCLIGEPGVGKTAVVEGLARLIAEGKAPPCLSGKRILSLDIPSMIAGAKYRGEFEERMKSVMAEAESDTDVILFIDELHVIVGAGAAEGAVDAANILKPALARGGIRLIGATTLDEYKRRIERDSALERRLQCVFISEPSEEAATEILKGLRPSYEAHHRIKISDGAIDAAVRLSERYISDRHLPDKAIDIMDEAAAKAGIEAANTQNPQTVLTEAQIAEAVTRLTGIPAGRLLGSEAAALGGMEARLCSRIIAQDKAVCAVCSAIRRRRTGVGDPDRPTGSFIFVGASGVGKTELARAVAEELFGSKNALIRFDMSEYMERHSTSRLIGSPPGYVGYGEGGRLTEQVRRKPYSVVLFDEAEKAHPDIFNLLLQILEDGRLTDSMGREVSFKNTVIIITSNAGISDGRRITGFAADGDRQKHYTSAMLSSLKGIFRQELLNRVDEIIVFDELERASLEKIASSMLNGLSERAKALGFDISFKASAVSAIAEKAEKDGGGARSVRRLISRHIEDKISDFIIDGSISDKEPFVFTELDLLPF